MTDFRCVPIDTAIANRFRATGRDDRDNAIRRTKAVAGQNYPCRHCLTLIAAGDDVLLASYDLPAPTGLYWTPSPVFLHAADCPRYAAVNDIAPIVRANALVSVRAYDADQLCLYDLGQVCAGADVDAPLHKALDDARTAFVNIHTARPGCLLTHVARC